MMIHVAGTLATLDGFIKFTAQSAEGAELRSLTSRSTWILEFSEHQWKIVHQHTSAPIDFKTTKALFNRKRTETERREVRKRNRHAHVAHQRRPQSPDHERV
jgi:SnoaL-like domain